MRREQREGGKVQRKGKLEGQAKLVAERKAEKKELEERKQHQLLRVEWLKEAECLTKRK